MICLDEMGPESAKSFRGRAWCAATRTDRGDGAPPRRSTTAARLWLRLRGLRTGHGRDAHPPYPGRTTANWVDFLDRVDGWLDPAADARLRRAGQPVRPPRRGRAALALAHPRWEVVFQPTYAAYLNLIEPWWKVLRRWPSRAAGSRPGRGLPGSRGRHRTGMGIAIPSLGPGKRCRAARPAGIAHLPVAA